MQKSKSERALAHVEKAAILLQSIKPRPQTSFTLGDLLVLRAAGQTLLKHFLKAPRDTDSRKQLRRALRRSRSLIKAW